MHLGSVMFHFCKYEDTFRRFCLELIPENLCRKVCFFSLMQLCCAQHLQARGEKSPDNRHEKICIPDKLNASYKSEIVFNIYGKRTVNVIEQGIEDEINEYYFNVKISSLGP